jgi:hypothetical protein
MEIINNNPYRQLGLLVGANAMQQDKHIKRIPMYLDAGDSIPQEYNENTFLFLGEIERTKESISNAASKLKQPSDKLEAALFWFYVGNEITDVPAFDLLRDVDFDEALSIWSKLTDIPEITKKNASAYHNLSNIYLSGIMEGTKPNEYLYEQGIFLKIKFLESDYVDDFKALATDTTYKTSKQELQLLFIKRVHAEIERNKKINSNKFLEIINKFEFSAKELFINDFVQKPIEQIERKIEENKVQRKADKSKADKLGIELFQQTSESIPLIKSILGSTNIRYASIVDKLADEILQCGIDYFKNFKDSKTDPGNASMEIFLKAKSLAIGSVQKQRCIENIENLQEWINNKPERDKQLKIKADLDALIVIFQEFDTRSESVENAKAIITRSKPRLVAIKALLGSSDELYLKLSTRVAMQAQSSIIGEVNKAQENLDYNLMIDRFGTISRLKSTLSNAWSATTLLGALDMEYAFKSNRYNPNKESLRSLCVQLGVSTSTYTSSSTTSTSSSSGGCYIATMAYGSYDHPQVLILRRFRDEILDKSTLGKWFIKVYYHYSPMLVEKLKNHKITNVLIRKSLNQFIKLIKP